MLLLYEAVKFYDEIDFDHCTPFSELHYQLSQATTHRMSWWYLVRKGVFLKKDGKVDDDDDSDSEDEDDDSDSDSEDEMHQLYEMYS